MLFNAETEALVLVDYVIIVLMGTFFLGAGWHFTKIRKAPIRGFSEHERPPFARFNRICAALLGSGFLVGGSWLLFNDFALPRYYVAGTVEHIQISHPVNPTSQRRRYYEVRLDRQMYSVTGDVYRELHVGEHVRAELGKGSRRIYRVTPIDGVL